MILGLTDIYYQADTGVKSVASLVVSCFYILLCLLTPLLMTISLLSLRSKTPSSPLSELFSGL